MDIGGDVAMVASDKTGSKSTINANRKTKTGSNSADYDEEDLDAQSIQAKREDFDEMKSQIQDLLSTKKEMALTQQELDEVKRLLKEELSTGASVASAPIGADIVKEIAKRVARALTRRAHGLIWRLC